MNLPYQNPPIEPQDLAPLLIEELDALASHSNSSSEFVGLVKTHTDGLKTALCAEQQEKLAEKVKAVLDFVSGHIIPTAKDVQFRVDLNDVNQNSLWELGRAALAAHGVFIVDNYFSAEQIDRAQNELSQIEKVARKQFELGEFLETDQLIVDHPVEPRITGFHNRARSGKCYVFSRPEEDSGIVEVVNVERACPTIKRFVQPKLTTSEIIEALNHGASSTELQPRHLNAYINATNPATRGLHLDTQRWCAKGFLYLTDVDDIADGPFAYVPGTHVTTSPMKRLCIRYNEQIRGLKSPRNLEMDLQSAEYSYPVLAKRGTFIIGYTCGIHRGMPRIGDTRREVLIQNYF